MKTSNEQQLVKDKSVFPVVSEEKRYTYTWDTEKYKQLDNKVQPLTVAECHKLEEDGYSLPPVLNEGSLLMRHPYQPKALIDVNFDSIQYLQEKFGDYAVILNYLGSKTQTLQALITKQEIRKITASGKVTIKRIKIKSTFNRLFTSANKVKLSKTIEGTKVLDYQKAVDYAEQQGLLNDPFVKEILELRKNKPIKSYRCDLVISKDYNDIMDVVASLAVMPGVFKLSGNFNKEVRVREEYSISQELNFE